MPVTIELLRQYLRLEGEDIIRLSTGKVVNRGTDQYRPISIYGRSGGRIQYHRAKFALAHGWLPVTVDHRDRNSRNDLLSNLRPATHPQQNFNQGSRPRKHKLPAGVYRNHKRFMARAIVDGQPLYLGTFDTPEEASRVVEPHHRDEQGEHHRHYSHGAQGST